MVDTTGDTADLAAAFRQKASYMKSWKPASTPSVRKFIAPARRILFLSLSQHLLYF